jgi:hypothetical protein
MAQILSISLGGRVAQLDKNATHKTHKEIIFKLFFTFGNFLIY